MVTLRLMRVHGEQVGAGWAVCTTNNLNHPGFDYIAMREDCPRFRALVWFAKCWIQCWKELRNWRPLHHEMGE